MDKPTKTDKYEVYKRVLPSVGPIIARNVFLLVNIIISLVVVLLIVFGNVQAGIFLGAVFVLNTSIAVIQDIRARIILENLQMLTALRVVRLNKDGSETLILAEEILKGDLMKLKLGDQAPCEGVLTSANNLEVSEALITGESDSFAKQKGDKLIAGTIVTSGSGILESEGLYRESRLSMIAQDVKKYSANPSAIQTSINTVIKYSGYILLVAVIFITLRGVILHKSKIEIVTNAGTLASMLVPQGLVVVITLLFAIGAATYAKKQVLFQEINATEKLGRIKNLCMDKTGTLTDNVLVVEQMHVTEKLKDTDVANTLYSSVLGLNDSSQTMQAIRKYLEKENKKDAKVEVVNTLPFSAWRRYGAVEIKEDEKPKTIFIGAPNIFLERIENQEEKAWLEETITLNTNQGKHVLCVAQIDERDVLKDLKEIDVSLMVIFVFQNTLRHGIEDAIKFFKDRKVQIRILSGDNPNTARAIAKSVGLENTDKVITGDEISHWTNEDFEKKSHDYTIFAQVLPEHKVKLIEGFKKDGFTAMVGDGVNDALAMKKADLGIAMFDGVPVTRQLADVILMTNSFSDLPGAVEVADHFIRSIEINSGVYINQSIVGFFLFVFVALFGYNYPLMPLNITFLNYFTVGFSGILISYWAINPSGKILPTGDEPFLKRIMPLAFYGAVIQSIAVISVFILSPQYLKDAPSNSLVGLAIILSCFIFLIFAVKVYGGSIKKKEKKQLWILGIAQLILFMIVLQIPIIIKFFNITKPFPSMQSILETILVVLACCVVEYLVIKKFFLKK